MNVLQPRRCTGLSVTHSGSQVILYHAGQQGLCVLNPPAQMIWTLCDGQHSVPDMERAIRSEFPVADGHDLGAEIQATVDTLRAQGLVE